MKRETSKRPKSRTPTIRNNLYMLRLVWEVCPLRVIGEFAFRITDFAIWTFYSVVFMRYLFGSEELTRTFSEAMVFVWVTVAVMIVNIGLERWFYARYVPTTDIRLHYALNRMLFDKASSVDIACYETPSFYGDYTKATTEAFSRAVSVMSNTARLIAAALSSVYVMITMISITWWSVFFVVLPLIGNLVFGRQVNKLYYERDQMRVPFQRRYDYVNRVVYLQKYAGEIRMTPVFSVLKHAYDVAYDGTIRNIQRFGKKLAFRDWCKNMLMFPLAFEGMWFVASYLAVVTKAINLGDFVVLSSAIVSTTWMLKNFTDALTAIFQDGLFAENLKIFLAYQPKIDEHQTGIQPVLPVRTIELRDVSFRYDGQSHEALSHISMTLHSGQKVAIVGLNGSGKSTLVKLIMRLYDPTEGQILLNGVDIREYDLHAYRMLIGTTFQDFAMFSATVMENVMMSRVEDDATRAAATDALKASGVYEKIATLQNNVDTILTREFDDEGAVLSGGENQKIAVARAFAKASPVVILDEPSSALDPIAEYNMYETILRLCDECDPAKGKIAIIISHRLSSAALSDHIYVLENGALMEDGTHRALMERDGAYANMFRKQAESYLASAGEEVTAHG